MSPLLVGWLTKHGNVASAPPLTLPLAQRLVSPSATPAQNLQINAWSLLVGCAVSAYISWMREQRALERFAEQLGPAGEPQLRRLRSQHPLYSHHRPVSGHGRSGCPGWLELVVWSAFE